MANSHEVDAARVAVVAHLERAEFYRETGRLEDYESALRDARRVDPLGPTAEVRAEWLARRSLIDEAIAELVPILAIGTINQDPMRFLDAARTLAGVLQRAECHEEADRVLQRAVGVATEHDLWDAGLLTALGVAANQRGELEAAGRLFQGARRIATTDGERAEALARSGEWHLAGRRRKQALDCLWRAYRLHAGLGDEVAAGRDLFHLGEVCWAEGRTRPAFRAWRKAVLRFERCGASDWAERVWQRLDEATRVIEVWNRDPEWN